MEAVIPLGCGFVDLRGAGMDLSILIPARNEMFLERTIQDILEHRKASTEVVVVLDGFDFEVTIPVDKDIHFIKHAKSVGQRAATNQAAQVADGKYLMKVDAHCAFDDGFDVKMIEHMQPNWTMVPTMRNLHAFDWLCQKCGWRKYQGPTPEKCEQCGEVGSIIKDIKWFSKPNPQSNSYRFDFEPHFQYFPEYSKRPEGRGPLTETMSLQGSCFMISKENYFKWNVCDEDFGSWGSQGIEVACKTWFNGGKVMVNHHTYYAHMFRTQGGDFGFPYPLSGSQVEQAKKCARKLFYSNWDGRVHSLSWLLDRFWPVPGWTEEQRSEVRKKESNMGLISNAYVSDFSVTGEGSKEIVYYTDNKLSKDIFEKCQKQLTKMNLPIVSCSLQPIDFGDNIVLDLERGYLTMFKQILAALERSTADVIFFCEHDVLYHPSHFRFNPMSNETFYYNQNVWKVDIKTGKAVHYDCSQTSGLVAYRDLLLSHYRKRVELVEKNGFTRAMGFEPGTHRREERVDNFGSEVFKSEYPNVDIRHAGNLTESRWDPGQFRNPVKNWIEDDNIPGWGHLWHFWKRI